MNGLIVPCSYLWFNGRWHVPTAGPMVGSIVQWLVQWFPWAVQWSVQWSNGWSTFLVQHLSGWSNFPKLGSMVQRSLQWSNARFNGSMVGQRLHCALPTQDRQIRHFWIQFNLCRYVCVYVCMYVCTYVCMQIELAQSHHYLMQWMRVFALRSKATLSYSSTSCGIFKGLLKVFSVAGWCWM